MVRLGGEGIGREGGPDSGEADRLADRPDQRPALGGTAFGGGALGPGGAVIGPVGEADDGEPAGDQLDAAGPEHRPGDEQGGARAGKGEEGREEEAGLRLSVVEMGVAQPLAARVGADAFIRKLRRLQFLRVDIQWNGRVVHGNPACCRVALSLAERFDGVLRTGRNAANRPDPDLPSAAPENRPPTLI